MRESSQSGGAAALVGAGARREKPGRALTSVRWARCPGEVPCNRLFPDREPHRQGTGARYPEPWRCVSRLGASLVAPTPCESSPFATLSRGAFSASSLVTPTRAATSRDRVVPVCNTDWSLPTPPHTAAGQERMSPPVPSLATIGVPSLFGRSSTMTTPTTRTTRRQPAPSPTSGPQAQARAQRQAYTRRKTRAQAKSEALR
jgi:hypothetical protein